MGHYSLRQVPVTVLLATLSCLVNRADDDGGTDKRLGSDFGLHKWLQVAGEMKADGQVVTTYPSGKPGCVGFVHRGRIAGCVKRYDRDGLLQEIHHFERGKLLFSQYLRPPTGELVALNQHDRTGLVIAAIVCTGHGGRVEFQARDTRGLRGLSLQENTDLERTTEDEFTGEPVLSEEYQYDRRTGQLTLYERIAENGDHYVVHFFAGRIQSEYHGVVPVNEGIAREPTATSERVEYYPNGRVRSVSTSQGQDLIRETWWTHTGDPLADCQYREGKPWAGTILELDPKNTRQGVVRRVTAGKMDEPGQPFRDGDPWSEVILREWKKENEESPTAPGGIEKSGETTPGAEGR